MSSAEDWARALESGKGRFTLNFERMGVEAECRTLSAAEVEECRRMGGERGMRYALYLACGAVREAGEQLKAQGRAATPFDATEGLAYADVLAAGRAILRQSGAEQARLRLETGEGEGLPVTEAPLFWEETGAAEMGSFFPEGEESGWETAPETEKPRLFPKNSARQAENGEESVRALAELFADRLERARSNR